MCLKFVFVTLLTSTLGKNIPYNVDQGRSQIVDESFGLRPSNVKPDSEFHHDHRNIENHRRHDIQSDQIIYMSSNEDSVNHLHRNGLFNNTNGHTHSHRRINAGFSNREQNKDYDNPIHNQRTNNATSLVNTNRSDSIGKNITYINASANRSSHESNRYVQNINNSHNHLVKNNRNNFNVSKNGGIVSSNTSRSANNASNVTRKLKNPDTVIYNNSSLNYSKTINNTFINTNRRFTDTNKNSVTQNRSVSTPNNTNREVANRNKNIDQVSEAGNKSTIDNEVKQKTTTKVPITLSIGRDDMWIWADGEPATTTTAATTTLAAVGLDDRAAFDGAKCPTGKAKLGTMCVDKE